MLFIQVVPSIQSIGLPGGPVTIIYKNILYNVQLYMNIFNNYRMTTRSKSTKSRIYNFNLLHTNYWKIRFFKIMDTFRMKLHVDMRRKEQRPYHQITRRSRRDDDATVNMAVDCYLMTDQKYQARTVFKSQNFAIY